MSFSSRSPVPLDDADDLPGRQYVPRFPFRLILDVLALDSRLSVLSLGDTSRPLFVLDIVVSQRDLA
jgi:hypothetical protein